MMLLVIVVMPLQTLTLAYHHQPTYSSVKTHRIVCWAFSHSLPRSVNKFFPCRQRCDGTDLLSLSTTTSLLLEMFLLFCISLKFQIAVGFCYLWECEKYAVMIMFALIEIWWLRAMGQTWKWNIWKLSLPFIISTNYHINTNLMLINPQHFLLIAFHLLFLVTFSHH